MKIRWENLWSFLMEIWEEEHKKRKKETIVLQQELIENSVQQSLSQSSQGICQDREGIGLERDST